MFKLTLISETGHILCIFLNLLALPGKYLRSTVVPSGYLAVLHYRVISFSTVCKWMCMCVRARLYRERSVLISEIIDVRVLTL